MAQFNGKELKGGFDSSIELGFNGSNVASEACLLNNRDLDEALRLNI